MACNNNISDYAIPSQFYYELASWWSEFRQTFATEKDWTNIIWTNCEIRIDNKPVYYKNYYEAGIVCTHDLLFNLNVSDAYNHLSKKIDKTNIFQLAGLRRSIPSSLRHKDCLPLINFLTFLIDDNIFDATTKKSKEIYALSIKEKAQLPYIGYKLQSDFNLTNDQLRQIFQLPHSVTLESYVKAFQYKVLKKNTNTKLYKMGFRTNDLCSFCKSESESLNHLFFYCPYSKHFWNDLEIYWCSVSSKRIRLSLQNVLIGIIAENADPLHLLLNYFIMIGKVSCGIAEITKFFPTFTDFEQKLLQNMKLKK